MYGFTGLYGSPYGIAITGRSAPPSTGARLQSTLPGSSRIPRITEGETVYERRKLGEWQVVAGPFAGRTIYPPPAATGNTYLALEAAWRRGQTDITPRTIATVEEAAIEDSAPPPPDYTRLLVGGLVIAGGIAGVAYLLRKKKGGT